MAHSLPINASDYYEFFPSPDHQAGDIWAGMPTFGMIGREHTAGIVITPACDLQNCKAETITYLPVVPIRQAFVLPTLLAVVAKATNGQVQVLGVDGLEDNGGSIARPSIEDIDALAARVRREQRRGTIGDKEKVAVQRAMAGLSILRNSSGQTVTAASGNDLRTLFGKGFQSIVEALVRNSYRSDMHFLPSDGQRSEWTVVPEPAVALFRYAFSVPIEIFDCARDVSRTDWEYEVNKMESRFVGARIFRSNRPMKRQTLRPRFAADLLTRYVAMHVRLGSPDFTDVSVGAYVSQVVGSDE